MKLGGVVLGEPMRVERENVELILWYFIVYMYKIIIRVQTKVLRWSTALTQQKRKKNVCFFFS